MSTRNPLSKPGLFVVVAILAFVGAAKLFGQEDLLASAALPLSFLCSLFFSFWIFFQYRTGQITLVSRGGTAHTYTQREDPILFYLIVLTGFLMGLFLVISLGSDLFLGCQYSLINPCYSAAPVPLVEQ